MEEHSDLADFQKMAIIFALWSLRANLGVKSQGCSFLQHPGLSGAISVPMPNIPNVATFHRLYQGNVIKREGARVCVRKLICVTHRLDWTERNHLAAWVPASTHRLAIRITNYDIRGHKIRRAKTNIKSIAMIYDNYAWCQSIFL